jgi:hypothetical protein
MAVTNFLAYRVTERWKKAGLLHSLLFHGFSQRALWEKTTTEVKPTIDFRTKKSKHQVEDCRPRTFAI